MKNICMLTICVCAFLSSCVEEDDFNFNRLAGGGISPTLSVPLGQTRISLDSLVDRLYLGSSNIQVDIAGDGQYALEYENGFLQYTKELPGLDSLKDVHFSLPPIAIPAGSLLGSGRVPFPIDGSFFKAKTQLLPVEDSIVLTEAKFQKGVLSVSVQSDLGTAVSLVLKSKNMVSLETGKVFMDTIPVGSASGATTIDMSEYKVTFQTDDDGSENNLFFEYRLLIDVGTDGSGIYSTGTDVLVQFGDLKLGHAKGKIGTKEVDIDDNVVFNLFEGKENNLSGVFDIAGATLSLEGESNLGFPVSFVINELSVFNDAGETRPILLSDNTIHVPAAPAMGQSSVIKKELALGTKDILSIYPNKLKIRAKLLINRQQQKGFIVSNFNIALKARLKIPLKGSLEGVVYETSFDIGEFTLPDIIKEMSFVSHAENGFPFSVAVQAYCISGETVIDSLFNAGELLGVKSGKVNSEGKVISSTLTRSLIDINEHRLNSLKEADRMKLAIHINTPVHSGGKTIALTQGACLNIRFGIKVKTQVTF